MNRLQAGGKARMEMWFGKRLYGVKGAVVRPRIPQLRDRLRTVLGDDKVAFLMLKRPRDCKCSNALVLKCRGFSG